MTRIEVIGAGVAGLAVATELASRGARVRLVERAATPGPAQCSWWAGGMLAPDCEGETAEEPVVRLGREAADWWESHAGGVTRAGSLVVALGRDRRELDRFARRTSNHAWCDADGVAEIEPDLAGRADRALFFAGEAHLDPRAALRRSRRGSTVRASRAGPSRTGARRFPSTAGGSPRATACRTCAG